MIEKSTKGLHFEKRVLNRLQSHFDKDRIIYNLSIPGRKKGETQIDFILLDETGLYVIEAKGYSGTVTGSIDDVKWTKSSTDSEGNTWTKQLMNPIFQNKGHIHYLKKLLADETIPLFSVAVLSDKCDFNEIKGKRKGLSIFSLKNFSMAMEELVDCKREVLDECKIEKTKMVLLSE